MELILSASDEDETHDGLTLKEDQRVDLAIQQMREHFGCTYDEATRKLLDDPDLYLEDTKVSPRRVKKLAPTTALGRHKLAVDLFRQVANSCPRQQELMDLLKLYHGQSYTREQSITKCFQYRWPLWILPLYILRIANFEILKLKAKYNDDPAKLQVEQAKYYENLFMVFLPQFFWDAIFKNEKRDQRAHALNALHFLLDTARNNKAQSYQQCYQVDREVFLSGHGQATRNYLLNYSNVMGKKSNKALVTIGARGGAGGTSGAGSGGNSAGGGKQICKFFNSKRGCNRGASCMHRHICLFCNDSRHGVENCYRICAALLNNGTFERFLKSKRMQVVSTSGDSGNGVRRSIAMSPSVEVPPKKKMKSGGLVQCVMGTDGKFYPIQSLQ